MNLTPLEKVLHRLREKGIEPRPSGDGYSCRCPAHDDHSPSLSIDSADDGKVLLTCHAGCSFNAMVAAMGLEPPDLFPDDGAGSTTSSRSSSRSSPRPQVRPAIDRPTFATAEDAVAHLERVMGRKAVRREDYPDADGQLVGSVLRFDGPDGKTFRPVSRTDAGSWVCEGMPAPRPLYRLPEVLAADGPIYVAEGEKAADALVSLGLCATTSPNGAKSAGKADWSPLQGRRVVIVPDRDDPGEGYAADVADLVRSVGATSVVVVRLADHWPELPQGGDAADWIEHHDAAQPDDLRHAVEKLVAGAMEVPFDPDTESDAVLVWEPFPTHLLPAPLATFVRETAKGIGCDESMVALPLLAALAGAIGNAWRVLVKPGWHEPSVLWTAIVSDSGSGKTPAFRRAMEFMEHWQKQFHEEHERAMADYNAAMLEHEAAVLQWKKDAAKGRAGKPPEKPEKPEARRIMANDTTIEALASILKANPRGLLVASDELAGWIAAFDCYKAAGRVGADRPRWLSMHNAGSITVDRKSSGTLFVESAAVSVTGGVQPGMLSRVMTSDNVDSGLLARLLIAWPPRRPKSWTTETASFPTIDAMFDVFRGIIETQMPESGPVYLPFSPDAEQAFREFFEEHAASQAAASGAVASMLAKMEGTAARLALVIHVARRPPGERRDGPIELDSVMRGITLARWFATESQRVYQMLLGDRVADQSAEDAAVAERWIEKKGVGGFASLRDLKKGLRRFRGNDDRAEQAALRLVRERRAFYAAPPTGGRPAEGLQLAPKAV